MQFSLYSFGCSTLLKILVQWQKKNWIIPPVHVWQKIVDLILVITKYCVLSAVSHRSIICLSLSASENNWSSPHSYITVSCTTLSNCCFDKNQLITRMDNQISSKNPFRHNFVPWNGGGGVIFIQPQVIRTPSYFMTLWWLFQRLTGF